MEDRKLRLFLAFDMPIPTRTALSKRIRDAIGDDLGARPREGCGDTALRPVPLENLHVTIWFFGSVAESAVPEIRALVTSELRGVPPLSGSLGPLELRPRPSRARLAWSPLVQADAAVRAGDAIRRSMQRRFGTEGGAGAAEIRPFHPHVTLLRVTSLPPGAARQLVERFSPPPGTFALGPVTLYRSETAPAGAKYTPLWRIDLPAGGTEG